MGRAGFSFARDMLIIILCNEKKGKCWLSQLPPSFALTSYEDYFGETALTGMFFTALTMLIAPSIPAEAAATS
jgi:hypothetical protein